MELSHAWLLSVLLLVVPGVSWSQGAVDVTAKPITQFKIGSPQKSFGALEFIGGIEFSAGDNGVQSLSSVRFRDDGKRFISVLDTGDWLTGSITRDADGRIAALTDVVVSPMRLKGARQSSKMRADAEGLALRSGEIYVSFEQQHRVDAYPDPSFLDASPSRTVDFLIPRRELRRNSGMETLVASPAHSRLKGALVVVAEHSLDAQGNLLAAVLDGPMKGQFSVVRNDPYGATDGVFLPDGDLLLLERRFSFLGGVGMRIRRIKGEAINPGAIVDGDVLIDADMSYEIDNMEGIDVIAGPEGQPHIILVSDDNGSIFQRNLMLEFRLNP